MHIREAPSHTDPYDYYAHLLDEGPVVRDEANDCWIVARAESVREVLTNPLCLTRPKNERVPAALRDGAMGDLFGRLVRLTDGPRHRVLKRAILMAIGRLDRSHVESVAHARIAQLDGALGAQPNPRAITDFMYALPVQSIASLIGVPEARLRDAKSWIDDYAGAVTHAVAGRRVDVAVAIRGHEAAAELTTLVRAVSVSGAAGPLFLALEDEARQAGCSEEDIVANAVGLMIQSYASVGSVIGLSLLALARHPGLLDDVRADRSLLAPFIQEVLRYDPSTSTTIRYMSADGVVLGQAMREGDAIIVAIAAANRDPALNPSPERFELARDHRRYLELGVGAHACPADTLAPRLAALAVDHLLDRQIEMDALEPSLTYASSAHVRIPIFGGRVARQ
jgi:cytochrome P450